jgi:hypothetical protein
MDARIDAQLKALQANKDNGRTDAGEPLSAQVLATPMSNATFSCAPSQKPASWWQQFIFPGALIPKADATLALRLILSQLRMPVDERVLDFQTERIVQTTFCEALERLTDSAIGWRTMTQIYERELRRADRQR